MSSEHHTAPTKSILLVLVGSALGTFLEFYSFALIGFFQQQVSNAFFPSTSDPTISLLQSFSLFGIAFLARPIGGVLFGTIADKYGRLNALRLSMSLMCIPTVCIGCTPTFSTIGYWSTAIVFTLRFVQGLAAGGEISSAMVYVLEEAPSNHKGLYLAILWIFGMGEILALFLHRLLSKTMSQHALNSVGFRIPFFLSIVIACIALCIRYFLPLSREFQRMSDRAMLLPNPLKYAFKNNLQEIVIVSLSQIAALMIYGILTQWVSAWLYTVKNDPYAYDWLLVGYICYVPLIALFGWLCDTYDAYKVSIYTGMFALITTFVGFTWMGITHNAIIMSLCQTLQGLGAVAFLSPCNIWALLFCVDPRTRTTVFGFGYNIGNVLIVAYSFNICTALQSLNDVFGGMYVGIFCDTILLMSLGAIWYGNRNRYRLKYENVYDVDKFNVQDTEEVNLIS